MSELPVSLLLGSRPTENHGFNRLTRLRVKMQHSVKSAGQNSCRHPDRSIAGRLITFCFQHSCFDQGHAMQSWVVCDLSVQIHISCDVMKIMRA